MMRTLHTNTINCPLPVLNIHGSEKTLEKLGNEDAVYLVRLLTYIPGERVETVPYTTHFIYQLGQTLANVHNALQNLNETALSAFPKIWSLSAVPRLHQFTFAIGDDEKRQLVRDVLDAFECQVLPNVATFSSGVLHGDFNEQNVLVRQDPQTSVFTVIGVIDFGDSEHGPYVFDVAIAIMYCMLQCREVDPLDACGHFLAGYLSYRQRALTQAERLVLWTCVAARFAQSLTMGAYTYSVDPTNSHVLITAKRGWQLLGRLWKETSREELETRLDRVLASYGYDS